MDNNNPTAKKLAGLRTFAKDQEKNTGVTVNEAPVSISQKTPVAATPAKLTSIDRQIQKIAKGEKEPEPTKITASKDIQSIATAVTAPKPTEIKPSIKESIATMEKTPPSTKPVKNNGIKIEDRDGALDNATIITDTKKDRFKLFPAIRESIRNWFTNLRTARQAKMTPKYTVPETSIRKGVIQKATSQTGRNTVADHSTIQDRIKQRLEAEVGKKEKDTAESKTIWTPNTETGFLLLEDPESHVTNVKVTPRQNFYTSEREIVVNDLQSLAKANKEKNDDDRWNSQKVAELTAVSKIKTKIPTPPVATNKIVEPTVIPEVKAEPEVIEPESITVVETPSLPPIKEDGENKVKDNPESALVTNNESKRKENILLKTNTNTLSFVIAVIILIILIVSGVGSSLFSSNTTETIPVAKKYPPVLDTDLRFVFQPMLTKASLIDRINLENKNTKTDVNQFVFITSEKSGEIIKPSNLLSYLEINPEPNFIQSIDSIYFGSVHQENQFVIFKTTDLTTAKGGMLAWENDLESDLSLILKLKNDLSTSTEEIKFMDGMLSGVDVRVLKNSNGEDKMIYGFINNETLIITKNGETFGELITLIKK